VPRPPGNACSDKGCSDSGSAKTCVQQRRTLVADPLEICHIDSFRGNSEGDARTCPRRYPRVRGDRAAADHAGRRRDAAGLPWTGHAPERCKPGALRSDVKFWPRIMTIAAGCHFLDHVRMTSVNPGSRNCTSRRDAATRIWWTRGDSCPLAASGRRVAACLKTLRSDQPHEVRLVDQTGASWNQTARWLKDVKLLRDCLARGWTPSRRDIVSRPCRVRHGHVAYVQHMPSRAEAK
jgi:hypothetical protein